MWYEIFKFELSYRSKRPETYAFFVFLFLFSLVGTDFIFQGIELGLVKKNAPLVIAKTMGAITGIYMIMASMIMGVPVLRDFQYNIAPLLFVNPVHKRDYLLGKFLGSFVVLVLIFSGVLLGMMLGEFMPWQDHDKLLPFNSSVYFQSFLFVTLPTLFFGAALFFVTGALTRKLIVVYTQGVILFVVFLLTKAITNEYWQGILDPFSLTTLTVVVKDWTAVDRNSQHIVFEGILAHNKLFWIALGMIVLILGYFKFKLITVKDGISKKIKKPYKMLVAGATKNNLSVPKASLSYSLKAQYNQLVQLSTFYCKTILRSVSFWAIVLCGMIIILVNSVNLGTVYGVDSYPATYFIVEELQETSMFFFIIILVFYSGELIWKERDTSLHLIIDATPVSTITVLASKFMTLLVLYVVIMVSLILSGVLFQTLNGYYHFDFGVYFFGFFVEVLPFLILYTFIAFFFQVITNQKYVGIIMVVVFFIINNSLSYFGVEHSLLVFGGNGLENYSEMNGYGHFLVPYFWIKSYWLVFGIILFIVTSAFAVRGVETKLAKRWKLNTSQKAQKPLLKYGLLFFLLFTLIGSYIFYNTNYLNTYWTSAAESAFRATYEKDLKQFEYLPQPKIIDVKLHVDLYPETRDYIADGVYILKNTTNNPIRKIHIQKQVESQVTLEQVTFEPKATASDVYRGYDYHIYTLQKPLRVGETITMKFRQMFTANGFEESNSSDRVVHNGTFLKNQDFPTIGYNKKYELEDEEERASFGLQPRLNKAQIDDSNELKYARSGGDSDGINFEVVVSTTGDQTAIARGTLLKEWKQDGRSYFYYKMTEPMINFYAIVSGKYEVKKAVWEAANDSLPNPVDLAVYYHNDHEYNVDRMLRGMKRSLDYFETHFSRYQHDHLRIVEFPRYAAYAQSFPATIPFSEALGFILDINDETDVDMAFYITAHEVAHQWWGMQVQAANVQGRNMILETLAQYSALMVLKENYADEKVEQFLQLQLQLYKDNRIRSKTDEPSLAFVENQDYIYYNKGALAMFEFQESIGEEKVNMALRTFISDWNSVDGSIKQETKRYATTKDLLRYFREVTPESLQYIVGDLFETADTEFIER